MLITNITVTADALNHFPIQIFTNLIWPHETKVYSLWLITKWLSGFYKMLIIALLSSYWEEILLNIAQLQHRGNFTTFRLISDNYYQ